MGKVVEKIKVMNVFEPERATEVEVVIDTGATMLVLPQDVIDNLNLRKMRKAKVGYANNKIVDPSTRKVIPNPNLRRRKK